MISMPALAKESWIERWRGGEDAFHAAGGCEERRMHLAPSKREIEAPEEPQRREDQQGGACQSGGGQDDVAENGAREKPTIRSRRIRPMVDHLSPGRGAPVDAKIAL